MSNTFPLLAVRGIDKTTPSFREQLVAGSLAHGLNPSYVAAVIAFESGFNPKAMNPDGGALGLLQWRKSIFPAVAKKAGMNLAWEDLPSLTAEEQLPLVFAYYADKPIRETSTPSDYYLAVFLPIGVGKPPEFLLGQKDSTAKHPGGLSLSKIYDLNRGLDKNPVDGKITVRKAAAPVQAILDAARGRTPLSVPLAPGRPRGLDRTEPCPGGVYSSPLPRPAPLPSGLPPDRGGDLEPYDTIPVPLGGSHDLPTLRRGHHGSVVCLLQRLLDLSGDSDDPDFRIVVDGEFGYETEAALQLHQTRMAILLRARGLDIQADGVCGPLTWSTFWQPWLWAGRRPLPEVRH